MSFDILQREISNLWIEKTNPVLECPLLPSYSCMNRSKNHLFPLRCSFFHVFGTQLTGWFPYHPIRIPIIYIPSYTPHLLRVCVQKNQEFFSSTNLHDIIWCSLFWSHTKPLLRVKSHCLVLKCQPIHRLHNGLRMARCGVVRSEVQWTQLNDAVQVIQKKVAVPRWGSHSNRYYGDIIEWCFIVA